MIGVPSRFWEEGVASIASSYSLPALKRCYVGSDGGGWCKGLPDYLHGPEIVHKLDPWHVNRAVKNAFPDHEDAAPLFELLYSGDIGYLKNNREAIEAEAPSMGTMEGTNAHLYAAKGADVHRHVRSS